MTNDQGDPTRCRAADDQPGRPEPAGHLAPRRTVTGIEPAPVRTVAATLLGWPSPPRHHPHRATLTPPRPPGPASPTAPTAPHDDHPSTCTGAQPGAVTSPTRSTSCWPRA